MTWLHEEWLGNSLRSWGLGVGCSLVVFGAARLAKVIAQRRLNNIVRQTSTRIDDTVLALLKRVKSAVIFILSIYFGCQFVLLPEKVASLVSKIAVTALLVQIAVWGSFLISDWLERTLRITANLEKATTLRAVGFLARMLFYVVIVLWGLDNLGVDITTLVAGLGVGGVAVALAVQNILGDLFASLTIVLDKPFSIGDFVVVGDCFGTIEHIGLKTTRLRSLSGEQLIFSNADLLQSRIRNYKRMFERRVVFSFGVVYSTPYDKLKSIPSIVKAIIESIDKVRLDRAHFSKYGESSLDFEVVYWVASPDYAVYMDRQQDLNLALFKRFEAEGIEFAYPTRTLYVQSGGKESGATL